MLTLINMAVGSKGPTFFERHVKSAWSEKFEKKSVFLARHEMGKGNPSHQTNNSGLCLCPLAATVPYSPNGVK
jgi:hypothetical protein